VNERGDTFKNQFVDGEGAVNKFLFMIILNLYEFVLILFSIFELPYVQ